MPQGPDRGGGGGRGVRNEGSPSGSSRVGLGIYWVLIGLIGLSRLFKPYCRLAGLGFRSSRFFDF